MLKVYALTDTGVVRDSNEDSFLAVDTTSTAGSSLGEIREYPFSDYGLALMVSDGMGGAAAGEVASRIAVETAFQVMQFENPPEQQQYTQKIVAALQEANRKIAEQAAANPAQRGMGATATLAGILGRNVFIGQVGDSRAYLIRGRHIQQLTRDQSFVNQLLESGKITEEEAQLHPRRNVILQALGNCVELEVPITSFTGEDGDLLLLCSDGLSGMLHSEEIAATAAEAADIRDAAEALVSLANRRGGLDNITVVLARFSRDTTESDLESEELAAPQPLEETAEPAMIRESQRLPRGPLLLRGLAGGLSLLTVLLVTWAMWTVQGDPQTDALHQRIQELYTRAQTDAALAATLAESEDSETSGATVDARVEKLLSNALKALQEGGISAAALYCDSAQEFLNTSSAAAGMRPADAPPAGEESVQARRLLISKLQELKTTGSGLVPAIAPLSSQQLARLEKLPNDQMVSEARQLIDQVFSSGETYMSLLISGHSGAADKEADQRVKLLRDALRKHQNAQAQMTAGGIRNLLAGVDQELSAFELLKALQRQMGNASIHPAALTR